MRILIAPDKFKGTLTSIDAARAMARGIQDDGDHEILIRPLADGGEGSHSTLAALDPSLAQEHITLTGPVGNRVEALWLSGDDKSAYFETAQSIGLGLPGVEGRRPSDRLTQGAGEWILNAAENGAASIGLFLGGSATVDGGFGLARALGFSFLDAAGRELALFADVDRLACILWPDCALPPIRVFTDVTSPYCGAAGSARVFARQKGAGPAEIEEIELRLEIVRGAFLAAGGKDLNLVPGSGAAGGLAGPLLAHPDWDVRVASGIGFFLERAGIEDLLRSWKPDLIVTGEGCTDASTLAGKVVSGIYQTSNRHNIPLAVASGMIRDKSKLLAAGLTRLWSTTDICGALPEKWIDHLAADRLAETTRAMVKAFREEIRGAPRVDP